MDNISIFAANSTIGGSIAITQNASTQGQCQLTNSMTAAAYASGIANNTASSGKDKKGQKFGNKNPIVVAIILVVILIIVIVVTVVMGKVVSHYSEKKQTQISGGEVSRPSFQTPSTSTSTPVSGWSSQSTPATLSIPSGGKTMTLSGTLETPVKFVVSQSS